MADTWRLLVGNINAVAALGRIMQLHRPKTWWYIDGLPYLGIFEDQQEAAGRALANSDPGEQPRGIVPLVTCAECSRIETLSLAESVTFEGSMWPCATAKAAGYGEALGAQHQAALESPVWTSTPPPAPSPGAA